MSPTRSVRQEPDQDSSPTRIQARSVQEVFGPLVPDHGVVLELLLDYGTHCALQVAANVGAALPGL